MNCRPPPKDFKDDKVLRGALDDVSRRSRAAGGLGFRFCGPDAFSVFKFGHTVELENIYQYFMRAIRVFSKQHVVRLIKSLMTEWLEHGGMGYYERARWCCEFHISQGINDGFVKSTKSKLLSSYRLGILAL